MAPGAAAADQRPRVVVVGLGPAGPELITPQTLSVLTDTTPRFVRTLRHPAATAFAEHDLAVAAFDGLYDTHDTFDEVYAAITDALVAAATTHGRVVYAVPGSPRVLERSVEQLMADDRVAVELVPAMSFLDLTWARLGIDPVEVGVRLVDGHVFATAAAGERGPLLVAHCHNQRVLSDIKLSVDEPGDTPVTVLRGLGTHDETITTVAWADLDRSVEADHLTSLWIPELTAPVAVELVRFDQLVQTLRRECPWDRSQTHASLRRHLIEEAYEVVDAIDGFDPDTGEGAEHLEEELGDLLFQVFLHAAMAAEEGWFELADVARGVHDKLHARHPHVFGSTDFDAGAETTMEELAVSWEAAKRSEKDRGSVMDGIARGLPALALAEKVLKKAASVGLEPTDAASAADALRTLLDVVAGDETVDDAALGRVAVELAGIARRAGIDVEMATRAEAIALAERVRAVE
ncbi:MAG: MazG nucleotide pyrophosphohydrolase domain-containing protein [Acidimicrobiales bacterium]